MKKIWKSRIPAEFSATKFRANSCSDLKQSPKFLLFLLAVLSIIYLQTGTLKQTGMQWESWEFIKRPLLDERNLNGIPWNACSSWFKRVFVVLSARLLRRVLHDLRRVVHLPLRELLRADRRGLTSHARRVLSKPSPPPRAEELLSHVTTEGANSITTLACRGIAVLPVQRQTRGAPTLARARHAASRTCQSSSSRRFAISPTNLAVRPRAFRIFLRFPPGHGFALAPSTPSDSTFVFEVQRL